MTSPAAPKMTPKRSAPALCASASGLVVLACDFRAGSRACVAVVHRPETERANTPAGRPGPATVQGSAPDPAPQDRAPNVAPRSAPATLGTCSQTRSVLPEAIETSRVHLRVSGRIGDLAVPEIGREGSGIDALVHQLEAAG